MGVTSRSNLFCNRRDWPVRKRNGNGIQWLFNKNRMKLLIKKSALKLPEIIGTSTFITKKLKGKLRIPQFGENLETEVSLKQFLQKTDLYWNELIVETYATYPYECSNVKSISSYCRQFQLTIFLNQTTIVTNIFH